MEREKESKFSSVHFDIFSKLNFNMQCTSANIVAKIALESINI